MSYLHHLTTTPAVRSQGGVYKIPAAPTGNSAGRARRFLILGNEGGTYYASERKLTVENARALIDWGQQDPLAAAEATIEVLTQGQAPKVSPALLAAAILASGKAGQGARQAMLPLVGQIPTASMFFEFIENYKGLKGKLSGRAIRRSLADWYRRREYDKLEYQMVKYQQRNGWSHRDVLRLAHVLPAPFSGQTELFQWAVGKGEGPDTPRFQGIRAARAATSAREVAELVRSFRLTREMLPSQWLNEAEVILALLEQSPATAMLRNLASYTRNGAITARGTGGDLVVGRLTDPEYMARAKIHPVNVLTAWATYKSGRSVKGDGVWTPVPRVTAALEEAFYLSFKGLPVVSRPTVIGIDSSGSMTSWLSGAPGVTVREAAAALAMAIVRASGDGDCACFAIDDKIVPAKITPKSTLSEAIATIPGRSGSTDLSGPTELARKLIGRVERTPTGFLMITDNEHNHRVRPSESLRRYREESGHLDARLVVMSMTASDSSIVDPNDPDSMDVVGFDSSVAPLVQEYLS